MIRKLYLVAAAVAVLAPAAAQAAAPQARQCFYSRDWAGWRAADEKTAYIKVRLRDIYRMEFKSGCPGLTSPGARLITNSHSDSICSPLDLDVKVSRSGDGFSTPCIVTGLSKLSPDEAKALPKKLVP